jgi:hypothetical protein
MLVIADLMVHRGQGGGTQKGPILTEPSTRRLTPSARPYRAGPQSLAASVPRTRREPLRFYRKSGGGETRWFVTAARVAGGDVLVKADLVPKESNRPAFLRVLARCSLGCPLD